MHRTTAEPEHSGRVRRALAAVATTLVVAALAPVFGESADAATVPVVGTLQRFPADSVAALGNRILPAFNGDSRGHYGGTLVAVPKRNQLWQMYGLSTGLAPVGVVVRDADSLKVLHSFEISGALVRGGGSDFGGDWMHAFDGDRRAFFLANSNAAGSATWEVVEVNLQTYAQRRFTLGAPYVLPTGRGPAFAPGAMEYDPHGDALLMLWGGLPNFSAGNAVTQVVRIDLKTRTQDVRVVRTCNGPLVPTDTGQSSQLGGIVTEKHVFFSCQRAGSIGAVVRIERTKVLDGSSTEDIVAGPAYLETAFADPGSGRIFLITIAGEIWAYDTHTMAFVGVVAGGAEGATRPRTSFGLDPVTGRLFFLSPTLGLGVAEGRFYPIPQARTYPDRATQSQERIISVAKSGRIFTLPGIQNNRAQAYTIYDVGQAPTPPPAPDPDQNTSNRAEQPGVTEARYFANGSGYGVRALLAKGISATPPQPSAGQIAPVADLIVNNINSKCGFSDRELVAGRVAKAEYDTGSTAAEAVGIDVDERSKLDLEHLSRCDLQAQNGNTRFNGLFTIFSTGPVVSPTHQPSAQEQQQRDLLAQQCDAVQQETNATLGLSEDTEESDPRQCDSGRQWTTKNAYCTSSSGGEFDGKPKSENEIGGSGSVNCPSPGGRLQATAVGHLTGGLKVGKAETDTEILRPKDGGLVSKVVAEAQDIEIAEVIRIGQVTATARSFSNGRPQDKAMSAYEFVVKGISLKQPNGTWLVLCEQYKSTGGKSNCDIDGTLNTLNTAAAGRAEFRLASGLDKGLLEGTKKGALTGVQKSTARQASDQALVGDRTTEVAALEMVVYNDNKPFGRARQIYQFAGVSTAATYNIALLPTGTDFPPDDDSGFDEGDLSALGADDSFLSNGPDGTGTVPTASIGEGGTGGIIRRVLEAVGRGIRMFFTNPRHALLLLTAWALFSLPAVLSRRRALLAAARSD